MAGRARIAAVAHAKAVLRCLPPLCLILASPVLLTAQLMTRLAPVTDRAFDDYIKTVEPKLDWQAHVTLDKPGVTMIPGGPAAAVWNVHGLGLGIPPLAGTTSALPARSLAPLVTLTV